MRDVFSAIRRADPAPSSGCPVYDVLCWQEREPQPTGVKPSLLFSDQPARAPLAPAYVHCTRETGERYGQALARGFLSAICCWPG
jgi:hypothetical protein